MRTARLVKKVREAIKKFSEGMRGGKRSKFRDGVEGLASEAKKQGRRKKLKDLLKKQYRCLSDCKSECEGECNSTCESNKKGGNNWGLGKSTNEPGDKTFEIEDRPTNGHQGPARRLGGKRC